MFSWTVISCLEALSQTGSQAAAPTVQERFTAEAAELAEKTIWLRGLGVLCGERLLDSEEACHRPVGYAIDQKSHDDFDRDMRFFEKR
jgi:hypothetical protein